MCTAPVPSASNMARGNVTARSNSSRCARRRRSMTLVINAEPGLDAGIIGVFDFLDLGHGVHDVLQGGTATATGNHHTLPGGAIADRPQDVLAADVGQIFAAPGNDAVLPWVARGVPCTRKACRRACGCACACACASGCMHVAGSTVASLVKV